MTQGLVRWQCEGDLHFVTASCWQRLPYLQDCFALAEEGLERARVRYRMNVVGYVFMPEHLHLLVDEPEIGVLAEAIKMFKLSVTLRQERRPFWQKRYYDRNVFTHDAMVEALRYIHRNPLKAGLVAQPEEWPWSSYRQYASGLVGKVRVDTKWAREEPR